MTTQADIPAKWYVPFAQGDGARVELPVTTADPTRASQTLGFPPLTMQPPESGGVPPQGEDFNGGMNQVARVAWWVLNGGGWPYDVSFATQANIQGYPNGATLQAADFRGDWINTADNNQNNPDTTGTGWVPGFQYGVTALAGLTGGTVTPTPAQAAKGTITLAGTLGSALTIVLPTWLKNWVIINNTTGAFVTIVKTAAGSGVTIAQDGSRVEVVGDGTNIVSAAASNVPGRLLRTTVYTRIAGVQNISVNGGAPTTSGAGTFTPLAATSFVVVEAQGGGNAGGGASQPSAGNISLGSPGGCGAYGKSIFTAATVGASQTITVGLGGTGVVSAAGGNGGSSSFGALLSAPGGSGSSALNDFPAGNLANGNSSVTAAPSGANVISIVGACLTSSLIINAGVSSGILPGTGAPSSMYGLGSNGDFGGTPGSATNFGAGGGASAAINTSSGSFAGGDGAPGVVIVSEYA